MNEYEKQRLKKQIKNETLMKQMQKESDDSLENNIKNANEIRNGLGELGESMSKSNNAKVANAGSKLYKFTGKQGLDSLKTKGVNAFKGKVSSFGGNPNSVIGQSASNLATGTNSATTGLSEVGKSAGNMAGNAMAGTAQTASTTANTASNASKVAGGASKLAGASKVAGAVGTVANVADSATKFAQGDAVGGGLSALKLASLAGGPVGWGIYALATIAEMFKSAQDKKRQKALSKTQEANAEAVAKRKENQAEAMQESAERRAELFGDMGTQDVGSNMPSTLDNMDEYKIDTVEPISEQALEEEANKSQSEDESSSPIKDGILGSLRDDILGEVIDSPTTTEYLGKQAGFDFSETDSPGTLVRDMAKTDKSITDDTKGMFTKGNIDIYNRPVVKNDDGTISTVMTMGFQPNDGEFAGKQVLIPRVSDDGRIMSQEEAIDYYYKTGKHLGVFNDIDSANKYAESLHHQQDDYYNGNRSERGGVMTGGASPIDNIDLIADQEKYMRDNNFTPEQIKGLRQGLNYGNADVADWIDQYNKGAGKENPIRIPTTEQEIELAKAGRFNPVPQEASVDEKKTLKDLIMQNIGDSLGGFAEGYRENRNNGFTPDNLVNRKMANGSDKTILNRAGEALGTLNRLATNPLVQGGLAGLAYGIDKGDALYGLGKGVEWAGNKAKSNMYAKELGQQPTIFGNVDANDYKALTTNAYRQQKLSQDGYTKLKKQAEDNLQKGIWTTKTYNEYMDTLDKYYVNSQIATINAEGKDSNQTRMTNVAEGNLEERVRHNKVAEGQGQQRINQGIQKKEQAELEKQEKANNILQYVNMSDEDKVLALPMLINRYGTGVAKEIEAMLNIKKVPAGL